MFFIINFFYLTIIYEPAIVVGYMHILYFYIVVNCISKFTGPQSHLMADHSSVNIHIFQLRSLTNKNGIFALINGYMLLENINCLTQIFMCS